jgi:hypothetical protein
MSCISSNSTYRSSADEIAFEWNFLFLLLCSPLLCFYSQFFDFRLGPNRESCLQWHGGATIIVIQLSCLAIHLSTLQRKSHLCTPRKWIARPQSRFPHSCVCERLIFIPRIGPHIFLQQNRQIMSVEIGTEAMQFLFWEYLFQIFGIVSSLCVIPIPLLATQYPSLFSVIQLSCLLQYSHPSLLLTVQSISLAYCIAIHLSCLLNSHPSLLPTV